MDDSTAALIAGAAGFFGAVIGGVLSGVYQHGRDWYMRPILRIDYAGKDGVNRVENSYEVDGKKVDEVYIRARVRNVGKLPAQNCRVYLTKLSEVKGEHLDETLLNDAKPNAWAGWDFLPRVVPAGADFYIDVARISKHNRGWMFSIEAKNFFASQWKLKDYVGTYRFHLLATADNAAPIGYAVDVDYDGDWHSLRARPGVI
jgi:hypothetical protein